MAKEKEQLIEVVVQVPTDNLGRVRFVPKSEGIKMVENGQASWSTRTLSFEEQLHTPLVEVVVPHPFIPKEKAVAFVPQWQAESMIKTGTAEAPIKK